MRGGALDPRCFRPYPPFYLPATGIKHRARPFPAAASAAPPRFGQEGDAAYTCFPAKGRPYQFHLPWDGESKNATLAFSKLVFALFTPLTLWSCSKDCLILWVD